MGKILSRNKTNLTWKSQKSVGKAIRRARSMGIIPVLAKTDAWKSNAGSYWDYSKRSRG
jgi:small subunit ribosomal protein S18